MPRGLTDPGSMVGNRMGDIVYTARTQSPCISTGGELSAHQHHSSASDGRKQQGSVFQRHSTLHIVCERGCDCDKANTHNSIQEFSPQGQ